MTDARMRQRIAHWKHVFDEDENAISIQLSQLAWSLAAFTCIVEIVRGAADYGNGKRLNGMVIDMLVSGFWNTTMQGVRKLAEHRSIHGPYGVCSLGGLLDDAKAARPRLTRQVFVEAIAGLEYNYRETQRRHEDFVRSQSADAFWVPREFHYENAIQRHSLFDFLSGAAPGQSNPGDIIREQVFDALIARLDRLSNVVEHVNVQIAHASTEASRRGRILDQWNLTDAKDALRELAQIGELAGSWLCFSGVGTILPHPQFDQFAHLDQPLFQGDREALQQTWNALDAEIRQWHGVDPTTMVP